MAELYGISIPELLRLAAITDFIDTQVKIKTDDINEILTLNSELKSKVRKIISILNKQDKLCNEKIKSVLKKYNPDYKIYNIDEILPFLNEADSYSINKMQYNIEGYALYKKDLNLLTDNLRKHLSKLYDNIKKVRTKSSVIIKETIRETKEPFKSVKLDKETNIQIRVKMDELEHERIKEKAKMESVSTNHLFRRNALRLIELKPILVDCYPCEELIKNFKEKNNSVETTIENINAREEIREQDVENILKTIEDIIALIVDFNKEIIFDENYIFLDAISYIPL
jgi:F0F1-type ATP synthase membrane subunit b/b'